MKNRMPEIGASGTVRGGDGNILTYSETIAAMRREVDVAIDPEQPSPASAHCNAPFRRARCNEN